MTNQIKMDRAAKTFYVSKEFLIAAGQFGTPEFKQYLEMRQEHPDYRFEQYKLARNENKRTYGELTYSSISDFIKGYETDEGKREDALKEFEAMKRFVKGRKGAYLMIKKWFLEKYKDEFNRLKEKEEAAKRAKLEEHLLYVPAEA